MQPPPPALRRVGVREIVDVLSTTGQVGNPSFMNTEASLRYPDIGYQRSGLVSTSFDLGRRAPVRLIGQASKGHTGLEREQARRAKVGYCPCGSTLAQVAVSPPSVLGPPDDPKSQGMHSRWGEAI